MNYRKIFLFFVLFISIFSLGIILGIFFAKKTITIGKDKLISSCWEQARAELISTCKPETIEDKDMPETNFYGNITEIRQEIMQVVIDPAPLGNGIDNLDSLEVNINEDTIMERVMRKTENEYQEELKQYNDNYNVDSPKTYPMPFKNEIVDINAFKAGQKITIFSIEDVRNAKGVTAEKIIINYQ